MCMSVTLIYIQHKLRMVACITTYVYSTHYVQDINAPRECATHQYRSIIPYGLCIIVR